MLALDEPTPEDDTFDINGFTFCIAKDLAAQAGDVAIDLTYMDFTVESRNPFGGGEGGCGGCSSGSCGI